MERGLEFDIKGDGIGHFEINGRAWDYPNELKFMVGFDQTIIKELSNQLDIITKLFPIRGKNE
jgi:hypothetical protein